MKHCKICKGKFEPFNSLQVTCSPACAIEFAKSDMGRNHRKKAIKQDTRKQRKRLKTRSDHLREAQAAFNSFIRARDKNLPCVSCGASGDDSKHLTGSGWDCGHYRSIGANPELRFEPLNAHKQCVRCNRYLSGNVVNYRLGLLDRIGAEKLAWLEGPHPPKKYTIDELKEIKRNYRPC